MEFYIFSGFTFFFIQQDGEAVSPSSVKILRSPLFSEFFDASHSQSKDIKDIEY